MNLPNIYVFLDKKRIDLDTLAEGDALIFIFDKKVPNKIKEIKAVKDKKYHKLNVELTEELRKKIEKYWGDIVKELGIFDEVTTSIEKSLIEEEIKEISCLLHFPYTPSMISLALDGSITIESKEGADINPIIKDNAGRLKGFEAIDFIRTWGKQLAEDPTFRGYDDGKETTDCRLDVLYSILRIIEPFFQKLDTRIEYVIGRFPKSSLTLQKEDILKDFEEYCCFNLHQNTSRTQVIEEWVTFYKDRHGNENPFSILIQQRRTGFLSIFNPKLTDSVKLFKDFLGNEPLPESLKKVIESKPARLKPLDNK